MEEVKWFASLGVGGVLAGVMFFFYRQDRITSEARLTKMLDEFRSIVTANTTAMVELSGAINHQRHENHQRHDREC